jgi:hypothetical protein
VDMSQNNQRKPSFVPQEQIRQQQASQQQKSQEPVVPKELGGLPEETDPNRKSLPVLEVKVLPSKFLPYPKAAKIAYNPYTFGEIKKFSQSKFSPRGKYEFILEGIKTNFDKMLLTFSDFLYLALLRKISSLGNSKFQVIYLCEECGFRNEALFNINEIDFKDLEVPELPLVVDIAGTEMHFSPLTIGAYFDLIDKNLFADQMAVYAKQCINLPYDQAFKLVYSASADDGVVLEEIDKMVYHSIAPKKIKCNNTERKMSELDGEGKEIEVVRPCDHENSIEIDSPEVVVLPFRPDRESIKSRISFGVKGKS